MRARRLFHELSRRGASATLAFGALGLAGCSEAPPSARRAALAPAVSAAQGDGSEADAGSVASTRARRPPPPSGADGDIADHVSLPAFSDCGSADPPARPLRVASWNIKAARDANIELIAEELARMDADVVALQEVDVNARRTGRVDQPRALAEALGYDYAFTGALYWDDGVFGLAVLSRLPFAGIERHRLDPDGSSEPRIVLDARVCHGERPVRLLNLHTDIFAEVSRRQLTQAAALAEPDVDGNLLLVGDFNQRPDGAGTRVIADTGLVDLFEGDGRATAGPGRIDYMFVGQALARALVSVRLWETTVSDHHALIAEFAPNRAPQ